jgi:hypothetical protein
LSASKKTPKPTNKQATKEIMVGMVPTRNSRRNKSNDLVPPSNATDTTTTPVRRTSRKRFGAEEFSATNTNEASIATIATETKSWKKPKKGNSTSESASTNKKKSLGVKKGVTVQFSDNEEEDQVDSESDIDCGTPSTPLPSETRQNATTSNHRRSSRINAEGQDSAAFENVSHEKDETDVKDKEVVIIDVVNQNYIESKKMLMRLTKEQLADELLRANAMKNATTKQEPQNSIIIGDKKSEVFFGGDTDEKLKKKRKGECVENLEQKETTQAANASNKNDCERVLLLEGKLLEKTARKTEDTQFINSQHSSPSPSPNNKSKLSSPNRGSGVHSGHGAPPAQLASNYRDGDGVHSGHGVPPAPQLASNYRDDGDDVHSRHGAPPAQFASNYRGGDGVHSGHGVPPAQFASNYRGGDGVHSGHGVPPAQFASNYRDGGDVHSRHGVPPAQFAANYRDGGDVHSRYGVPPAQFAANYRDGGDVHSRYGVPPAQFASNYRDGGVHYAYGPSFSINSNQRPTHNLVKFGDQLTSFKKHDRTMDVFDNLITTIAQTTNQYY